MSENYAEGVEDSSAPNRWDRALPSIDQLPSNYWFILNKYYEKAEGQGDLRQLPRSENVFRRFDVFSGNEG